jgi:glycosyltransferase involved in cell wall biosynthesis
VFLNTSVYEGMPNTFLQSWARGVPTVATVDVGARLGKENVYTTIQSPEEGAREVERLFTDQLHWARSSARCREYFDANHSPAEALARYERIFAELSARP